VGKAGTHQAAFGTVETWVPAFAGTTMLILRVVRHPRERNPRQTYTGALITSTLHMPIVPDGQDTPGGAAAGTAAGLGGGGAAAAADAGGAAAPDGAGAPPIIIVAAGALGAGNGSATTGDLLSVAVATAPTGSAGDAARPCSAALGCGDSGRAEAETGGGVGFAAPSARDAVTPVVAAGGKGVDLAGAAPSIGMISGAAAAAGGALAEPGIIKRRPISIL